MVNMSSTGDNDVFVHTVIPMSYPIRYDVVIAQSFGVLVCGERGHLEWPPATYRHPVVKPPSRVTTPVLPSFMARDYVHITRRTSFVFVVAGSLQNHLRVRLYQSTMYPPPVYPAAISCSRKVSKS